MRALLWLRDNKWVVGVVILAIPLLYIAFGG